MTTRVLLADDHILFVQALAQLLTPNDTKWSTSSPTEERF